LIIDHGTKKINKIFLKTQQNDIIYEMITSYEFHEWILNCNYILDFRNVKNCITIHIIWLWVENMIKGTKGAKVKVLF
jgi:hypothetical protein